MYHYFKNIVRFSLKWFAPILSFTTEEIYQLISKQNKSIHMEKFMNYPKKFKNEDLEKKWTELIKIRNICNISIEEKRANKEIGSSLEAEISIQLNNNYKKIVTSVDLSELCITSKAEIIYDNNVDIVVNTKSSRK